MSHRHSIPGVRPGSVIRYRAGRVVLQGKVAQLFQYLGIIHLTNGAEIRYDQVQDVLQAT